VAEPGTLPDLNRDNISDQTYRALRQGILAGQFASGKRLKLDEIETQMGISRTPLKVALDRLAAEGLVEIVPRRGTYVTIPTRKDIEESFSVRLALETYAVRLVATEIGNDELQWLQDIVRQMRALIEVDDHSHIYKRYAELDHEFHRLIVDSARNDLLSQFWERVSAHARMARVRYRRADRKLDLATREHEGIVRALGEGDREEAQALIAMHIDRAKRSLQQDLDSFNAE